MNWPTKLDDAEKVPVKLRTPYQGPIRMVENPHDRSKKGGESLACVRVAHTTTVGEELTTGVVKRSSL